MVSVNPKSIPFFKGKISELEARYQNIINSKKIWDLFEDYHILTNYYYNAPDIDQCLEKYGGKPGTTYIFKIFEKEKSLEIGYGKTCLNLSEHFLLQVSSGFIFPIGIIFDSVVFLTAPGGP